MRGDSDPRSNLQADCESGAGSRSDVERITRPSANRRGFGVNFPVAQPRDGELKLPQDCEIIG